MVSLARLAELIRNEQAIRKTTANGSFLEYLIAKIDRQIIFSRPLTKRNGK